MLSSDIAGACFTKCECLNDRVVFRLMAIIGANGECELSGRFDSQPEINACIVVLTTHEAGPRGLAAVRVAWIAAKPHSRRSGRCE